MVPTDGLPIEEDDHHYNLIGQKQWAERGFDLLARGGLAPWATAPP